MGNGGKKTSLAGEEQGPSLDSEFGKVTTFLSISPEL